MFRHLTLSFAMIFAAAQGSAAVFTYETNVLGFARSLPAVNGVISYGAPVINEVGDVAVVATVQNGGVISEELYRFASNGALTVLARTSDAAPGSGGLVIGGIGNISINNAGTVAFEAELDGAGATLANDLGVYKVSAPGAVAEVFQVGDVAPDTGGEVYKLFDDAFLRTVKPSINDAGDVFFATTYSTPGSDILKDGAVFRVGSGSSEILAREGTLAAGGAVSVDFPFSEVVASNTGQGIFRADSNPGFGTSGIFLTDSPEVGGDLEAVFTGTKVIDGVSVTAGNPFYSINDTGDIVFEGTTAGGETAVFSRFVGEAPVVRLVSGGLSPVDDRTLLDVVTLDLNASGQIAFFGLLSGVKPDGGFGNPTGYFLLDGNGDISTVLGLSETLDFDGVLWNVTGVRIPDREILNNAGAFTFNLLLRNPDDGTFANAVVVKTPSPIPLPAALPLLAAGIGALMVLRVRRRA